MTERFTFEVATHGRSTALVYRAADPNPVRATLVLGHGAGAAQTHPFMVDMAGRIAARGVDVVTFDFLYMAEGRKMPDRTAVLEACWHSIIASVRARGGPGDPLFCGGKSMGGRIISNVSAQAGAKGLSLRGLVFLGYPLHPIDKPKVRRDQHLPRVPFPMLFVQGTRDELGTAAEIRALVRRLPRAKLHVVDGGDHSLAILKRDAKASQDEALDAAADAIALFVRRRARRDR